MNKLMIILSVLLVALAVNSCTKKSADVSRVTTYADMALKGPSTLFWELNKPFVDPGSTAMEGENDITDKIKVSSNVDANTGGIYNMTYSVNNSDGFPATITRTVIVYDKTAPLNGYYQSRILRTYNGATANRGPFKILVFGVGNNQYYIEDLLGGWYYIGSGYGSAYAGSGIIKLSDNNTFTIVSAKPLAWGYPALFTDVSTYDPATKTLVLNTRMADAATMLFKVTLSNPSPLN